MRRPPPARTAERLAGARSVLPMSRRPNGRRFKRLPRSTPDNSIYVEYCPEELNSPRRAAWRKYYQQFYANEG